MTEFISIHTIENQVEAQVIEAALKEAGVKFIMRTFEDSAYNGIFVPQKGYAQVLVAPADSDKAKQIISIVNAGK